MREVSEIGAVDFIKLSLLVFEMASGAIAAVIVFKEGHALFLFVFLAVDHLVKQFISAMCKSTFVAIGAEPSFCKTLAKLSFVLRVVLKFFHKVYIL